jgi:adenine-specific DNA-methyltransferase
MNNSLQKFQDLLRELFQFDSADLDFGIYRIMNHKREVIERFITHDLPNDIAGELERGALAEQSQAARELGEAAAQIRQTLGADAIDAEGNLIPAYHGTPLGKKYLDEKAKAIGARGREALEVTIYNHLYAFFSRYYQDGDFISKRRYSKRERYAIPYNGEEVYLYWANHDQYYVKTGEYFPDYTFTAPNGVTVHFNLQTADIEQNNVKGEKRFFVPLLAGIAWDETARQLVIPFEYRPLTEQEKIAYGQKNLQETILAEAVEKIPRRLSPKTAVEALPALDALVAEKRKTSDGQTVTFLEHHLRQYTRRNTSDFFIHKDLKGFLSRELDFYLKNEVLNLDEIEASGEERAEGWFQMMRAIKAVGGRVIEFLHQIEEFQKTLWEKRKFITETQYCITLGTIAEEFYPEIAACEPQWDEWKDLFHIDEEQTDLFTADKSKKERRIAFLKAHPTLMLDTKHFGCDFVDSLLGSFNDLDKMTDGLLVHGENFQALNLLLEKYRAKAKCVYIDPPYNTGSDEFLYKDGYQASSWAAMLSDRILLARNLLARDALFFMQIGDEELARSRILLDNLLLERKNTAIVRRGIKNVQAQFTDITRLAVGHDSVHIYSNTPELRVPHLRQSHDVEKPGKWDTFWRGTDRHTMRYELFGQYPQSGQWRWEQPRTTKAVSNYEYYSKYQSANKRLDEWYVENLQAGVDLDFVRCNEEGVVQYYVPPQASRLVSDNWLDISTAGTFTDFPTEKHTELLQRILSWNTSPNDTVLDFFAGSGSTGHAAFTMLSGRRKCILVEVGQYFDTILLPRIKKVTFTPAWKDGKPKRMATAEEAERGPRIVKYIRLESYEDALNNIAFDDASGQQGMKFDDYLLQYMLKWETRASETLLNVEKLSKPFHYKLHIHANGQARERLVDIPETFNYLLGLHVQTRRVYFFPSPSGRGMSEGQGEGDGRRYLVYRGTIDQRRVVIIWRETRDWQQADFERDRDFVAEQRLTEGADEVFVNGDSLIPGARALEPIFKARMFAPVEA